MAPNTPKPKAAQLPSMTTMTNDRFAQPHWITHQKTIPDVQIQHNKQGTIQNAQQNPTITENTNSVQQEPTTMNSRRNRTRSPVHEHTNSPTT